MFGLGENLGGLGFTNTEHLCYNNTGTARFVMFFSDFFAFLRQMQRNYKANASYFFKKFQKRIKKFIAPPKKIQKINKNFQ